MKAPFIPLIATALLVLLCPPALAQDDATDKVPTPEELDRLVGDKVMGNWNIVAEAAAACKEPLTFKIRLGAGSSVEDVVLTDPVSPEAVERCRPLADSARRAILKSSPLAAPYDFTSITLTFDASEFQ